MTKSGRKKLSINFNIKRMKQKLSVGNMFVRKMVKYL